LALCSGLAALPWRQRAELSTPLAEVAAVLRAEDSRWLLGAGLELGALRWEDVTIAGKVLRGIASDGRAGRFATELASAVASQLADGGTEWTPEAAIAIADRLIGAGSAGARMALSLVVGAGRKLSWREDCAACLRRLRAYPDVGVQTAALGAFTAPE
jgi:hypothetical protein